MATLIFFPAFLLIMGAGGAVIDIFADLAYNLTRGGVIMTNGKWNLFLLLMAPIWFFKALIDNSTK